MIYELLPNGRGVLIDRAPILSDVRDTYEVSFLLSENGSYLALFTDAAGIEYRKAIKNGKCQIPKELLKKEQYASLIVSQIDGERVLRSWECEPLKITAMLYLRQTQWEVSGGMTNKNAYERMAELERLYSQALLDFGALCAAVEGYKTDLDKQAETLRAEYTRLSDAVASVKRENEKLVTAYNEASKIINDLAGRLAALEKNYDPTIIE